MTSELASKIVKQVEYYFSDINLCRDEHLKKLINGSEDGWVSFEEMLKFPRLAALSKDNDFITKSINDSTSEIVEAGEKGLKRKSSDPIPENFESLLEKYNDRSVYVKGFDLDVTFDQVVEYVEKHGGPTFNVHMRKMPRTKKFKGSIFATFKTVADAEKLLKNEEAKKFGKNEMIIKWSKDYHEEKKKEIDNKKQSKKEKEQNDMVDVEKKMVKGALLELDGLKKFSSEEFNEKTETLNLRGFLNEKVKDIAEVVYVDYFNETGKGIIRFNKENCTEAVKEKLYETSENKDSFEYVNKITARALTGDEELEYWKTVCTKLNSRKNKRPNRNGGPVNKRKRAN